MKVLYILLTILFFSLTLNVLAQEISCNVSFIESDWSCLGPFDDEASHLSRITGLFVDPTNKNVIYIGTRGSGLWETTDGSGEYGGWVSFFY